MPDKNLTELLESMYQYREEFEDWSEDEPVLVCPDCYEEMEDEQL